MATRFAAIDLSQVTPPPVVVAPDAEAIIAARKADIVARILPYDPVLAADVAEILKLESEPMTKLSETGAYREVIHYQRVNDAALSIMLAFSQGGDLDRLGDYYGVTRLVLTPADPATNTPAVMESDTSLRRRIQLAPEAFSSAGPVGAYVFYALSVSANILDARTIKMLDANGEPTGGVQVLIVTRDNNGVPSSDLLAAVAARFRDDNLTPLTDMVAVLPATFVDYTISINLEIGYGPDAGTIKDAALAAVEAYLADHNSIGANIPVSGLIASAFVKPVQRVTVASPAADIVPGPSGYARCTGITITSTIVG